MKTHRYKIGDRVVIRHGACGAQTGCITKLTWYPVRVGQSTRATYTVKGSDNLMYPLLGLDKESIVGNICTKDTKVGHVIDRSIDYEDIKQPSNDELKYKVHGISDLRELCKKRKLAKYGRKADLIDRLIIWDKKNEN